ncbi:2-iminoacetate synthase ThiH [Deltaproteobacteria bacterium TL4]
MSGFRSVFDQYQWQDIQTQIASQTSADVERALSRVGSRKLEDFMALISPVAQEYLDTMAELSHRLTKQRFGNTLQMYIPLYVSNECKNLCTYCGFSHNVNIPRLTLNEEQLLKEVEIIKAYGYEHILLVSGEDPKQVGIEYFKKVFQWIRPHFAHISMEVQPLSREHYEELIALGLNTVLVYQETYGPGYAQFHPKGNKSKFDYRLETPDRLGEAQIHKIGLGILLGLDDWRSDSWFVGLHLDYLEKKYWKTKFSVSFPRLRPATGCQPPKVEMTPREQVQLICAWRLFNPDVELSLSTRESAVFRDNVLKLGITSISAGSCTEPGGYALKKAALEQFETDDKRSPQEVAAMIRSQGYEPVWKDWDIHYGTSSAYANLAVS